MSKEKEELEGDATSSLFQRGKKTGTFPMCKFKDRPQRRLCSFQAVNVKAVSKWPFMEESGENNQP